MASASLFQLKLLDKEMGPAVETTSFLFLLLAFALFALSTLPETQFPIEAPHSKKASTNVIICSSSFYTTKEEKRGKGPAPPSKTGPSASATLTSAPPSAFAPLWPPQFPALLCAASLCRTPGLLAKSALSGAGRVPSGTSLARLKGPA
ncbi:hypothetical protein EV356DRAFT_529442 [Viridothelium virens]|uniref:Uncharacterized protein n=1 Tax=Viridothelium virens TaxID=1048519 RepID=A0A6A6HKY0_VIRVR|nr:hypothetical protein EV356DRAFT_529442 [Viridothelium virens]